MAKKKEEIEEQVELNEELLLEEESGIEGFLEQHKSKLFGGLVLILAVVGGVYFWNTSQSDKEENAELDVYRAEYFWAKDSVSKALVGNDASIIGLEAIAEDYSGTKQANRAHFIIGVEKLKAGDFEGAVDELKKFSADDELIQSRAYALIGDAYSELGNSDESIAFYKKAAERKPNAEFTPAYQLKLALAYQNAGAADKAAAVYESLIKQFPKTAEVATAKKRLAKVKQ